MKVRKKVVQVVAKLFGRDTVIEGRDRYRDAIIEAVVEFENLAVCRLERIVLLDRLRRGRTGAQPDAAKTSEARRFSSMRPKARRCVKPEQYTVTHKA